MNIAAKILMATALAMMLASCDYKDLDIDDDYVEGIAKVMVVVNHDSLDFTPGLSRVVIYPIAHTPMSRTERNIKDSLQVKLWEGSYNTVSYNDDSEVNHNTVSNDSTHSILISTSQVTTSIFSKDSLLTGAIYDSPDRTAISNNDTLNVIDGPGNRIVLRQKEVTELVTLKVRGQKHFEYINDAAVCLGNCHVEYNVNKDTVTNSKGNIIAAASSINAERNEVTFKFNTFGTGCIRHFVSLAVQGQNFVHFLHFSEKDMSIKTIKKRHHRETEIVIDTDIDIKDLIPKGSGFSVTTDDWETKWEDCFL